MNDPNELVGRIYATSSQSKKDDALSKLDTAISRAQKARDAEHAGKVSDAFYWWNMLFDGAFPAYG